MLPFYVLHQTVIVVIAFLFLSWQAAIPVKYAALLAATTAVILGSYRYLIRPWPAMRFLFGMRSARPRQAQGVR